MQEFTCLVWLVRNAFVFVPTTARCMLVEKDPQYHVSCGFVTKRCETGMFTPLI